jgi:aspartyl aminopeptidase
MKFYEEYKNMMENYGLHELTMVKYIEEQARRHEFANYNVSVKYRRGHRIMFKFRDKFIALVKLGDHLERGANIVVSHIDSPRLDVMPGNPIVVKPDGVFLKVLPYGGIIYQSWLDIPLALIGRVYVDGSEKFINTTGKFEFTITSLLPHLDGRKEMSKLQPERLLVRLGENKETVMNVLHEEYGIVEKDFELADFSFVPVSKVRELGLDKDLITGYGHDDSCCAYSALQGILNSRDSSTTQIAIFASYEETGSAQTTGCQSEFVDDIFLELLGDARLARQGIRNSKVISADVCAGYESNYASHFEDGASAIVGKGVGIVPFLGKKRGNDTEFQFRNYIKELALEYEIPYQVETTKVSEAGGGTVSTFFATRGCHVIDVGTPVLAMHSPQEVISKKDLKATYDLYKAFLEN